MVMILKDRYLVVTNHNLENEEIHYNGDIEFDAFKKYKRLRCANKRIFKANVKMCKIGGDDFVHSFQVIERIS